MISSQASIGELTDYVTRTQHMKTLKESGAELVRAGVTTVEELVKVAYHSL